MTDTDNTKDVPKSIKQAIENLEKQCELHKIKFITTLFSITDEFSEKIDLFSSINLTTLDTAKIMFVASGMIYQKAFDDGVYKNNLRSK